MGKLYNQGMSIDTGSANVGDMFRMLSEMSSGKRADAQLAMQQAQHDYQMKNLNKIENSANAIDEWASKGLDYNLITSDPTKAYTTALPSAVENWKGYSDSMSGFGLTPSQQTFSTAALGAQKQYMTQVAASFNALSKQLQSKPGTTQGNAYRVLKENYGADTVYANMIRAGFKPNEVTAMLEYNPDAISQPLLSRISQALYEPAIEGVGGGLKVTTPATIAGVAMGGRAAQQTYGGYKELLEQAKKDWGSTDKVKGKKGKGKLSAAENFKKKYGITKTAAGGSPGKGNTFTASSKLKELARSKGYSKINLPGLKAGKALLPYAIGGQLGAQGSAAIVEAMGGGEIAQDVVGAAGGVGGAIGMKKVAKKLADPKVMKRIMPILQKAAPKLAAKIALSTTGLVVPEGISSALGAAGLLWSAYDLAQLARQVPEIYQALAEG